MKLLATDFDRTFFDNNNYYKNINYANRWRKEGNLFVIVTGRNIEYLLKDIKNTKLQYDYLICNDGGIIFDNKLDVIYRKDISRETSVAIAAIYEKSPCLSNWYIDTGTAITNDKSCIANGLIGMFRDNCEILKLLNDIRDRYKDIDGYMGGHWINITEKSVNKGSGIHKLISLIGVNASDVYTIGDDINDVSMSDYDFNSFCMTNSIPELKKKTKKSYTSVYKLIKDELK
ncbi:MAG: HAD family hydrolase [Bacilli bacterium]